MMIVREVVFGQLNMGVPWSGGVDLLFQCAVMK